MSFVFRVSRGDIESEFPGFIPESPTERFHADRPINSNSAAFLVASVLLLFLFFYSHQMSSDLLLWLVVAVFLMATILKLLATCQQLQAQVRAHAAAASGLLGHAELRLQMPQSIALATRGRLQGLRLQLAQLDREFDELEYDTLRALDSNFPSASISMSEKEINALPVHNYYVPGSENSSEQLGSSSSALDDVILKKVDSRKIAEGSKTSEDELTCIFCLEQVQKGDLLRSLPCLHQFHTKCIDRWLRLRRTCPVCKFQMSSGWQGCRGSESDASDMV